MAHHPIPARYQLRRGHAPARLRFERPVTRYGAGAQAAVRHALTDPDLSTVEVGAASLEQLDEALAAFVAGPLPAAALEEAEQCYREGL